MPLEREKMAAQELKSSGQKERPRLVNMAAGNMTWPIHATHNKKRPIGSTEEEPNPENVLNPMETKIKKLSKITRSEYREENETNEQTGDTLLPQDNNEKENNISNTNQVKVKDIIRFETKNSHVMETTLNNKINIDIKFFEIRILPKPKEQEGRYKINMSKKENYIKIFRFFKESLREIDSIRMLNKYTAEITPNKKEQGRAIFEKYVNKDPSQFKLTIPNRAEERLGVVRHWPYSVEELQEEIVPGQNIISIERMKKSKKTEKGFELVNSHLILVKFRGCNLPNKIVIMDGYTCLDVDPYVRKIRQCYTCLKYGHIKKWCRSDSRKCFNCGMDFHGQCDRESNCANCNEQHGALDKKCIHARLERATNKFMAYKNMSFQEARKTAKIELGIAVDRRSDESHFDKKTNWYHYNTKEFPSLAKQRKPEIKIDFWEDQPCSVKETFWTKAEPTNHYKPKSGQRYTEMKSKNRFVTLTEEDHPTDCHVRDEYDNLQSYQERWPNSQSPKNKNKSAIHRTDNRERSKTNSEISEEDFEKLLEWIRQKDIEDKILKSLNTRGEKSKEEAEKERYRPNKKKTEAVHATMKNHGEIYLSNKTPITEYRESKIREEEENKERMKIENRRAYFNKKKQQSENKSYNKQEYDKPSTSKGFHNEYSPVKTYGRHKTMSKDMQEINVKNIPLGKKENTQTIQYLPTIEVPLLNEWENEYLGPNHKEGRNNPLNPKQIEISDEEDMGTWEERRKISLAEIFNSVTKETEQREKKNPKETTDEYQLEADYEYKNSEEVEEENRIDIEEEILKGSNKS